MRKITALSVAAVMVLLLCASVFSAVGETESGLQLWFEHPTERVSEFDTEPSGMESYEIQMAKNEIEGAQVILFSEEDLTGLTLSLSSFTDGEGNTLTADLFWEYYTPVADDLVPDAIPPLTGSFDLDGGYSKAFYFKIKTLPETPAGRYSAVLTVKDAGGTVLKTADVFASVFDFALPEKTSCATAVYLDGNQIAAKHADSGLSWNELYKIYYDYMLENRVCAYNLPVSLMGPVETLTEYLDNPRVNSFRIGDFSYSGSLPTVSLKGIYRKLSVKPEWLDKAYFYYVDEPRDMAQLDEILAGYEEISAVYPNPQVLVPIVRDIPVTEEIDAAEYIREAMGIWCPISYAFTDRNTEVDGAKWMQPEEYDSLLGTFEERMKKEKEAGKKIWWYTCCTPQDLPYNNILLTQPGLSGRLLFWQQKQYNIEGYLYYYANLWFNENYWDHTDYPWYGGNAYGDGILLYDGAKYGIVGPIGSLRFEAIRDGIEDFEVLTMLENTEGRESVDAMIEKVSKNLVESTTDGNLLMQTKNELYTAVEKALRPVCPDGTHTGGSATCSSKAVCEVCGSEYGEFAPNIHTFEGGVCNGCGALLAKRGDMNLDGNITSLDSVLVKRYLAKWDISSSCAVPEILGDVNRDGSVGGADAVLFSRYLAHWQIENCLIGEDMAIPAEN